VPELVEVPGATLWTASQGDGVPLDNLGPVAAPPRWSKRCTVERPDALRAALRAFLAALR
jgi:hypothetical protein